MPLSRGLGWQEHSTQVGIHSGTGSSRASLRHSGLTPLSPVCSHTEHSECLPKAAATAVMAYTQRSFACNQYLGLLILSHPTGIGTFVSPAFLIQTHVLSWQLKNFPLWHITKQFILWILQLFMINSIPSTLQKDLYSLWPHSSWERNKTR